jgi:hypothetical protein
MRNANKSKEKKKISFVFSNEANDFLQFSSDRARLTFEISWWCRFIFASHSFRSEIQLSKQKKKFLERTVKKKGKEKKYINLETLKIREEAEEKKNRKKTQQKGNCENPRCNGRRKIRLRK